jgi:hypothetical protein
MSKFFAPNIGRAGRVARAIIGVVLLVSGLVLSVSNVWVSIVLTVSGAFGLFEAFRGWCVMRACGFKTRI